jgi:pimeloyl-ACP methyl ester carboxylesterase
MHIVQKGSGPPLVLIPGIQGRWEYLGAAVDALATSFRVITFSLCDEPSSGGRFERPGGVDSYVAHVVAVLDELQLDRAVICGVSFGGLIAIRFAARYPGRTIALVLASTPGPGWHLHRRHLLYARMPRLLGPLFLIEAPRRLREELAATFPDRQARRRFVRSQLRILATAPLSLSRMAARAQMISTSAIADLAGGITVPTLVVTGERALDHVVSTDTSSDYQRLIRGARSLVLEHTGHLGVITRPGRFAAAIREFLEAANHHAA